MDNDELPVWMKRKEPAKENTTAEHSTVVSSQKPNVKLRCIALGETGIRMANKLIAPYKGRIPFTRIEDADQKELEISAGHPGDRLILYDSSEVQLEQARKFVTVAKIGGRVIVCEVCEYGERPHTVSQVGADVLIRTTSPDECKLAVSALLHMTFTHGEIIADMDDFFATFCDDDYVMVNSEKFNGINGWLQAARRTAAHWKNAADTPDSYLLSFRSNEKMMNLMAIQKLSNIIMGDGNDQKRAIWEVSIDDEPEDIVSIITFAGMKPSRSEGISSEGTLCENIIYQDRVTQLVRDYVTSAHTGGNVIQPEKIPQVFLGFRIGLSSLLNGSAYSIEE